MQLYVFIKFPNRIEQTGNAIMNEVNPYLHLNVDKNNIMLSPVYPFMRLRMRNTIICIGENKGADQRADQRLFHYKDRTIPLFSKSKFSSL